MNISRLKWFAMLLIALLFARAAGAAVRHIAETDLFRFQWIGDPQISRDGAEVAYVVVRVDEKKETYETSIWSVSSATAQSRQLTAGKQDSSPRWSPDGKWLAFLRQDEKDSKGKPTPAQIWVLPMSGGEPQQLTRLPKGAASPVWSMDGNRIAFNSGTNELDLVKAACAASETPDKQACLLPRETDVQIVTRAAYRTNGAGYTDFTRPKHIWTVAFVPGNASVSVAKQVTRGPFNESSMVWTRGDERLCYITDLNLEPYNQPPQNIIHCVPSEGGEAVQVLQFAGNVSSLSSNPQGTQIAYFGTESTPVQSHTKTNLWVLDLMNGGQPRNLSAKYDWEIGGGVIGDQGAPRAGGDVKPLWDARGQFVTTVVAREGRANLVRFSAVDGGVASVTAGDQAVLRYTSNGSQTAALISTPTELNDLFLVDAINVAPRRLTTVNQKQFSELNLTAPKEIWFRSFDARRIHALVQLPPNFDSGKKYPLILNIHGGPHAAYGFIFFHEIQWMAAKGYVVLYPNPRGSTSYGEQFANVIQYRYPGDDYKDLMSGVDELIKLGYVDEKRLGVTGGSGGGLLTNWAIGHTDRFAAAVSQRDIASWADWWYSADFTLFQPNWFRKPPFDDPDDYRARSPITYINKVKTPTMFILGDADSRTPPEAGGDQMFRALKYRKIPATMIRFPGESHDLSRAGKPWHRVERLQHIVNWFDLYLLGKKTNDYDLVPPTAPDLRLAPAK
ncbi:MAG: S9 family peptidase [Betaproteobacteria bacterium]